jgi:thioredoxin-dependent adenylylsulfate APS reductase
MVMIPVKTVKTFAEHEAFMLSSVFEPGRPEDVLAWAFDRFGANLAIVTSFQQSGMVIIDMATKINPDVRIVTIDTGRLHEETYTFMQKVGNFYGINIEVQFPDSDEVRNLVSGRGINLFYESVESRLACCDVRKVHPLEKVLQRLDAWVTGLRRSQSATRTNIRKIELDRSHGNILKINPLADWTLEDIEIYSMKNNVPQHPLYDQGYTSIGCEPCTRSVQIGEDSRSGRWWWEKNERKECGMHCQL